MIFEMTKIADSLHGINKKQKNLIEIRPFLGSNEFLDLTFA